MDSLNFNLEGVPVSVKKVNFDGLGRTQPDFVASAVHDVLRAKTFGELVVRVGLAQDKLRKLEIFRDVGVIIDVHKSPPGEDAKRDDGYDVTFVVDEFGRLAASAKTEMGAQADAQVKTGLRMPNLLGRGEILEVEYSHSSADEKCTEVSLLKPLPSWLHSSLKGTCFLTKSPNVAGKYLSTRTGVLLTYLTSTDIKLHLDHKLEYEGTWRELTPAGLNTPYSVRMECGHSFKSAVRHQITLDVRDKQIFPTRGTLCNLLLELSGIFGDVKYHKVDLDLQHNIQLPMNMDGVKSKVYYSAASLQIKVFQTSFRMGVMTPFRYTGRCCGIADKFFLGGPTSLRGFTMRGINLEPDETSLGGMAHWSTAMHLYTPLPSLNRKYPLIDNFRLHFFANAGNLANMLLSENILHDIRSACGVGLAFALGNFGRLEVNYCWPITSAECDKTVRGMQLGVGVHFL